MILYGQAQGCFALWPYRIKYDPQKFYDRIDTMVVVERQKTKELDFSLPLKEYTFLSYKKYSNLTVSPNISDLYLGRLVDFLYQH